VLSGPGWADDHINLKADQSGRVYAAVKVSLDDVGGGASVPQVVLLVRDPSTGDRGS
jgi:hypothetical protein